MKLLIAILLLSTGTTFAQDRALYASEDTLVAGVVTNIVHSFNVGSRLYCSTTPGLLSNPCQFPTQDLMLPLHIVPGNGSPYGGRPFIVLPARPIARTVSVSVATAGTLIADHYIVKKWPKSKRWISMINFSFGGLALYGATQ